MKVQFEYVIIETEVEGPEVEAYLLKIAEMIYFETEKRMKEWLLYGVTPLD